MEAFGTAATVLQLIDIAIRSASALVEYTRDTRNATADRKLLAEEAGSLTQVLKRLRHLAEDGSMSQEWFEERKILFRQFGRALDDSIEALHVDLETGAPRQESRMKSFKTLTTWAFTKHVVYALLERVTRLQQYASALLLHELHSLVRRIDERQQRNSEHARQQDVFEWLTPLRMREVLQTIASRAGQGSGEWCLESDEFVAWRTGQGSRLWCPGISGAGKTVVASIMYESLRKTFGNEISDGRVGLAIAYLRQLLEEARSIDRDILDLHTRCTASKALPTSEELASVLAQMCTAFEDVFIIVDALDECSEEVRWGIQDALHGNGSQIHLALISRPLEIIDKELESYVLLPIRASRADLELFIDQHIEKNRHLKRICTKSVELRGDIKNSVIKTAKDMFLLARLHIESLAVAAALSISHVRKKLQSLPETLQGTYEDALRRIEAQEEDHRTIGLTALAWLSYAFRPLTVGELQHALVIEPGQAELDEEMFMEGASITALCAGLVVLDTASDTVTFVHYTASKFFTDMREQKFPGFHATITMNCVTCLAIREVASASVWSIVRHYPLACYAAQFIGDHARQTPEEALEQSVLHDICYLLVNPDKRKALLSLLDSLDLIKSGFYDTEVNADTENHVRSGGDLRGRVRSSWISVTSEFSTAATLVDRIKSGFALEETSRGNWTAEAILKKLPEITALHLAASMGLAKVASMPLDDVPDVDAVDESGKTALTVAIERGFEKAVELLVGSGASVELDHDHGVEVFLLVTERDWHGVANIIAENMGYDSSRSVDHESSPTGLFLLAAYFGHQSKLEMLVRQCKTRVDEESSRTTGTALFLAVERGHIAIITFLLCHGVNVDARDSTGQTVLHRAIRRGSLEVTDLLLRHGASLDCKNDSDATAWSANLRTKNYSGLNRLLNTGSDPNVRGPQGVSELYKAAENGETEVVRYMLDSGTDPSIKTQFLWAPLHWAAYYGHTECAKLLLLHGAERSPVSDQDSTPLDLALQANQIAVIDILTRAGCLESRDVDPTDQKLTTQDELAETEWVVKDDKLSLAFDKPLQQGMEVGQYVYPSTLRNPKGYIFQISDLVDSLTTSISVRRSPTRARIVDYPLPAEAFNFEDALFEIRRLSVDHQTLELWPMQ